MVPCNILSMGPLHDERDHTLSQFSKGQEGRDLTKRYQKILHGSHYFADGNTVIYERKKNTANNSGHDSSRYCQ
jgi:hypothetical protein